MPSACPEHDNDQQVLNAQFRANATIDIENPRGDVSITAGDGPSVEVQAHEVAYADSDNDAQKNLRLRGCARHGQRQRRAGQVRQQQQRPRSTSPSPFPSRRKVTVNAGHGDVTAAGLGAGINLTASHGDVHLNSITGSVAGALRQRASTTSPRTRSRATSPPTATCNDLTLSEIKGKITPERRDPRRRAY